MPSNKAASERLAQATCFTCAAKVRSSAGPNCGFSFLEQSQRGTVIPFLFGYCLRAERIDIPDSRTVTQPDGQPLLTWVDAHSFLEEKVEGTPRRRLDGKDHNVATFLRDYRTVDGLMVAFVSETVVDGIKQTEKIRVDTVVVNPRLDDALLTKP